MNPKFVNTLAVAFGLSLAACAGTTDDNQEPQDVANQANQEPPKQDEKGVTPVGSRVQLGTAIKGRYVNREANDLPSDQLKGNMGNEKILPENTNLQLDAEQGR
jgi:hypothetical protein